MLSMPMDISFAAAIPCREGCGQLFEMLQEADNQLCKSANSPGLRLAERGGPTVLDIVGRSNPWAKEWSCSRKDCAPCNIRCLLAAEA